MIKTAKLLSAIYKVIHKTLYKASFFHGEETTLQVLKEQGKKAKSKSYLLAYSSPEQT